MKYETYLKKCYGQAVQSLPPRLRACAMKQSDEVQKTASEFRLRSGQHMVITTPCGDRVIETDSVVRHEELAAMLDLITGSSLHCAEESLKNGYITLPGGHRVGLCGTAVIKKREIAFVKNLSSVSVRIARQIKGVADEVLPFILQNGSFENTLIVSAPGCGKTTLLRDLIRQLAGKNTQHYRISLIDERGEIAAKWSGVPQLDVGVHTDVLDGVCKADGSMMLLRTMSPQIIAMDEITAPEDVKTLKYASHCGVGLLATAHGYDLECLMSRPLYREMMEQGIFCYCIVIEMKNGERNIKMIEL